MVMNHMKCGETFESCMSSKVLMWVAFIAL